MIQAAIFDLDGTLVESLPGIALALNRGLESRGHATHPEDTVRTFIGDGTWMLVRRAIPDAPDSEVDAVEKAFREEYDSTWQDGTTPFDGIMDMLRDLSGLPLAVLSNKPHKFTVAIVDHLFPADTFQAVLGLHPGAPAKPDPSGALAIAEQLQVPHSAITFVGDSTMDYDTATKAGMSPLLVDWGYHTHVRLLTTGAPILNSVAALADHLAALRREA